MVPIGRSPGIVLLNLSQRIPLIRAYCQRYFSLSVTVFWKGCSKFSLTSFHSVETDVALRPYSYIFKQDLWIRKVLTLPQFKYEYILALSTGISLVFLKKMKRGKVSPCSAFCLNPSGQRFIC